jgi:hypothetical protein
MAIGRAMLVQEEEYVSYQAVTDVPLHGKPRAFKPKTVSIRLRARSMRREPGPRLRQRHV